MNVIISEQQLDRFKNTILNYLDSHFTPYNGWKTTKEYKKEMKENDGEIFLMIDDVETPDDGDHMWYSIHTNPHVNLPKEICPLVLIPDGKFNSLEGYFGDMWKPIFIEWFQNNTGLKVKTVDNFGWERNS